MYKMIVKEKYCWTNTDLVFAIVGYKSSEEVFGSEPDHDNLNNAFYFDNSLFLKCLLTGQKIARNLSYFEVYYER